MEARDFYDGLGEDYDRMVSWEGRLSREGAFFEHLFDGEKTRSVLDAGCGTGMHLAAFARRGFACAGADLSPAMIEQARRNLADAGVHAELAVAGFGGIAPALPGPWDAVTCLGNSLPHLPDDASLARCFADFSALLRTGGILVIQNRNYDRLLRERTRFMPVAARSSAEGETLFLRITDFPAPGAPDPESVSFTIVTLKKRAGSWLQSEQTTPLRAMRRVTLERALDAAGFTDIRVQGGYGGELYDAPRAPDLILVARRR